MSPACADEEKYAVIDRIIARYQARSDSGDMVAGRAIIDINTVNGVRFTLEGGAWGLVRASSNSPNLVVVVESLESRDDMRALFEDIKGELARETAVGAFDQEL
jgi:phosphomannomutase/phosphoglucomutase